MLLAFYGRIALHRSLICDLVLKRREERGLGIISAEKEVCSWDMKVVVR